MYAAVYPNIKTRQNDPFVYEVPIELMPYITRGSLVEISFRNQKIFGLVADLTKNYQSGKIRLKPKKISRVITNYPVLTPTQWQLASWLTDNYRVNMAQALFTIFPDLAISVLQQNQPRLAQVESTNRSRDPKILVSASWSKRIDAYQRLVKQLGHHSKQIVIIAPDSDQLKLLASSFDQSIIFDTRLSTVRKAVLWKELLAGESKIVIGSRSSLFLPLPDLRLVICDRPYHPGMFEQRSPRYSLWQLALKVSKLTGAYLVFGDEVPVPPITRIENVKWSARPITSAKITSVKVPTRQIISDAANKATIDASKHGRVLVVLPRRGDIKGYWCRDCQAYFMVEPRQCPNCRGSHLRPFGYGIETLAKLLAKQSPPVKVSMIDQNQPYYRDGQIVIATQRIFDYEVTFRSGIIIGLDQYLLSPDPLIEESIYRLIKGVIHRCSDRVDILTQESIDKFLSLLSDDRLAYQYFLARRQDIHAFPYGHIIKVSSIRLLPDQLLKNIRQIKGVIDITPPHHPQFNQLIWQVIITADRSAKMSDIIQSTKLADSTVEVDPLNLL